MRRLRHHASDVQRVSMVAVLVLEAVCCVHLGGIRSVWLNRRARSVGQVGTPGLGRVLAVCVLRVGATAIARDLLYRYCPNPKALVSLSHNLMLRAGYV